MSCFYSLRPSGDISESPLKGAQLKLFKLERKLAEQRQVRDVDEVLPCFVLLCSILALQSSLFLSLIDIISSLRTQHLEDNPGEATSQAEALLDAMEAEVHTRPAWRHEHDDGLCTI